MKRLIGFTTTLLGLLALSPLLVIIWILVWSNTPKAVITDSGGIIEEATVMGVPCMTLRDSTERPETVTIGTNELIGTDPANLHSVMDRLFARKMEEREHPGKMEWQGGENGLWKFWNSCCYYDVIIVAYSHLRSNCTV